jgi:hypothetical protein
MSVEDDVILTVVSNGRSKSRGPVERVAWPTRA